MAWNETEEWYGRKATFSYMFLKAVVMEVKNSWSVANCDEHIIGGIEKDYGTAKHKAYQALLALTEGTA